MFNDFVQRYLHHVKLPLVLSSAQHWKKMHWLQCMQVYCYKEEARFCSVFHPLNCSFSSTNVVSRCSISIDVFHLHLPTYTQARQSLTKIQQTKMLVTCQRFDDLFLFGLVWQYSSVQTKCNKGRFKVMATYLRK